MSSWLAVLALGESSFGTSPQNPDMPSLSAFIAPYVGSQTGFGLNLVHVPYRGQAPALTDLLGGQVQVSFASMASSIEYIRAGKLRALAVTTATRSEALPDIPTVAEFV